MRFLFMALPLATVAAACSAGEPSFATKPALTKAGDQYKIEFALAAASDVEVAMLDAHGKVVRHLAAGVLGGEKPPPEPLKPGLAQALEWDGTDDAGKPAAGSPFSARVSAGMKPEFDGFLLYNPDASGTVRSLAVGPKGSVYLFHADFGLPNWGGTKIKIISREGKHLRAVMPCPADLAPERTKALGAFRSPEGDLVPYVRHLRLLSFYPEPTEAIPGSCSPAVDSKGRVYWLVLGPALAALDADGGAAYETVVGPRLLPDIKNLRMSNMYMYGGERPSLALSGDEKHLYFSGLWVGQFEKKDTHRPLPCVFRVDLATRGPGEVFLGKLDAPGKEKEQLTAPCGLAVAKGLIYVADRDADRVAVFKESDRSFAGELKVKAPDTIGVDPATGAVYVCSVANPQIPDLIKFEGYQTGKELCRLALPKYQYANEGIRHRIAVDASAQPVLIWVPNLPYTPHGLLCIEDAGGKFVLKGDPRSPAPWAEGARDLSLDRLRGELYVKAHNQMWFRIDERTGKTIDTVSLTNAKYNLHMGDKGSQLVASPDGSLVTLNWDVGIVHHDRTGKPTNWPGRDTDRIPYGAIMCFQERHLAMLRPDEFFVILDNGHRVKPGVKDASPFTGVDVMGTDGKFLRTLVWQCSRGAILRVDPKGNIYLAEPVKPPGRLWPEFFDGKVEAVRKGAGAVGPGFWNSWMYGSIVKFPASGGAIWYDKNRKVPDTVTGAPPAELLAKPTVKVQAHLGYSTEAQAEIQGAEWYRFGFSPHTLIFTGSDTCMCYGSGFDVDPYGRVFFPNLGQFRVEVVDTANNPITMFGKYGNQDSGGKDAAVKKPEIPLAWPLSLAVSDTHVYVADDLSRRVVKVKLAYAAQETCAMK